MCRKLKRRARSLFSGAFAVRALGLPFLSSYRFFPWIRKKYCGKKRAPGLKVVEGLPSVISYDFSGLISTQLTSNKVNFSWSHANKNCKDQAFDFYQPTNVSTPPPLITHIFLDLFTLPETNIALENGWLEDEISFRDGLFAGAMLVSGSVCLGAFFTDWDPMGFITILNHHFKRECLLVHFFLQHRVESQIQAAVFPKVLWKQQVIGTVLWNSCITWKWRKTRFHPTYGVSIRPCEVVKKSGKKPSCCLTCLESLTGVWKTSAKRMGWKKSLKNKNTPFLLGGNKPSKK